MNQGQFKEFVIAYTVNDQQTHKPVRARSEESAIYQFLQE